MLTHLSKYSLGSPVNSPLAGEEGPSGVKTTLCPVCEEVIHGSGDELNSHVEACLRKVWPFNVHYFPLVPGLGIILLALQAFFSFQTLHEASLAYCLLMLDL